jgi:hypothetical protein
MTNFTRLILLFILIVLSQSSFADGFLANTPSPLPKSSFTNVDLNSFTTSPAINFRDFHNTLDVEKLLSAKQDAQYKSKLKKYKKKFKRTLTFFPAIKPPVRDVDPVSIYINSKETYSKPHFLSLLQYFLFRLTPF